MKRLPKVVTIQRKNTVCYNSSLVADAAAAAATTVVVVLLVEITVNTVDSPITIEKCSNLSLRL